MHVALRRLKAQLWTYIRGVALPGEEPLIIWTPPMVFAATVASLVISLALTELLCAANIHILDAFYIALAAIAQSAIFSLHQLQHQASRDSIFSSSLSLNRHAAKLASIASIGPNPTLYRTRHIELHHNANLLATILDEDIQLIVFLGYRQGRGKDPIIEGFYSRSSQ
jgi:fatty acid desaturase